VTGRGISVGVDVGGTFTDLVAVDARGRVEIRKVLGSFEHDGLVKRDGAYYSENWDSARHKVRIRAETTLGKFEIDRR